MKDFEYAFISECGRRYENEDSFGIWEDKSAGRWLGIVCDGLGGHYFGKQTSQLVTDVIMEYWKNHAEEPDTPEKVVKACKAASRKLDMESKSNNYKETGTTMVMASIHNGKLTVAHIGDSRCYVNRPDEGVVYETKDHVDYSFGWEKVERCFFSFKPEVAVPDVVQLDIRPGDRILLCSDGLYKSMPPEILKARMMDNQPPHQLLDVFAFLCEKNGDDNYTALLNLV